MAGRRASWEGEVWLHRPTPGDPPPGRPWRAVVDGPGARALGLPAGRFFQVRLAAGTACLGPIVGLYVPGGERPAAAILELNQGHAVGLDDGLVVCFTPRAVDWERPLWPGTAWVGGRWVEGLFPAPEVVYKRFSITVAHQREWEARWGRRYVFNSNVWLSKWRIHQLLASDPRTAPLLPETRRLAPEALQELLGRYGAVYIKPFMRDLGRGVVRVEPAGGGGAAATATAGPGSAGTGPTEPPEGGEPVSPGPPWRVTYRLAEPPMAATAGGGAARAVPRGGPRRAVPGHGPRPAPSTAPGQASRPAEDPSPPPASAGGPAGVAGQRTVLVEGYGALLDLLHRLAPGSPFLVQQGLALARWDDRPFDFRIMVQRTAGGRWRCTAAVARVAPPGAFVTHIRHGATPMDPAIALETVFGPARGRALAAELEAAALAVAAVIDRGFDHMADLGLDLAVDRDGRVWFLECNGGPDLGIFAHDREALARIHRAPIAYAAWLAGWDAGGGR
ncbi:YheC/YheD family endospore coat-associated protein [Thermaerobacter litoralis]